MRRTDNEPVLFEQSEGPLTHINSLSADDTLEPEIALAMQRQARPKGIELGSVRTADRARRVRKERGQAILSALRAQRVND